ncbi:CvfB family protein [Rubritalea marina]|uniref:CvfB family protein n=1 Tax=Rubritalea marina TaxID=361055 RepID=UPI0004777D2E|nr:S1-like domain-containing RNA-binding protein [Rubritalea marina]
MIELGRMNTLEVVREEERGYYLEAGTDGEILLPRGEAPEGLVMGDPLPVFIYRDSADRLIATTRKPKAMVGDFALLEVTQVTSHGAFLNWGLVKDLMLPFGEQKKKVSHGVRLVVRVYVDEETRRIAATARLGRYLGKTGRSYFANEEVALMVVDRTELGYRVVVENEDWGLVYHNQIFQTLDIGQCLKGYVSQTRDDGKLDIILQKPGPEKAMNLGEKILNILEQNNGFSDLGDKADPSAILAAYNVSKKTYKRALSQLYKERKITFEDGGVRLLK